MRISQTHINNLHSTEATVTELGKTNALNVRLLYSVGRGYYFNPYTNEVIPGTIVYGEPPVLTRYEKRKYQLVVRCNHFFS